MKNIFTLTIVVIIINLPISAQWTEQYHKNMMLFSSAFFVDESNGFVVGTNLDSYTGIIYGTTNGGVEWFNVPGTGDPLSSVWFSEPTIGFAVGNGGTIIKTTDGGGFWSNRPSGTSKSLSEVFFISPNVGWVVGSHNTDGVVILKTTDQGETWVDKSISLPGILSDVYFTDNNKGWAVGYRQEDLGGGHYRYDNIILKTTDGGENWVNDPSGIYDLALEAVYFTNETTGWVGGSRDHYDPLGDTYIAILKTTDGGSSWVSQVSNKTGGIGSIKFCDEIVGWAAGGGNYKTTDGGESWIHQNLTDIRLNNMFFVNPTTGWGTAVHRIYKYQSPSGIDEQEEQPSDYLLSQNFPNPFNPTTVIEYKIPELNFVTLKVYDVLGNEIVTLVNEEKSAGSYEVEFYGVGVVSGIYFYRLQAGDFIETKKMVLMK
jgi:photosystem II stability/assembly factor-like uncharacterized protein